MKMRSGLFAVGLVLAVAGCDSNEGGAGGPGDASAEVDATAPGDSSTDGAGDTSDDSGPDGVDGVDGEDSHADADADAGGDGGTGDVDVEPGPLLAGFAERDLGFPLGAATVGYGPTSGPKTPFAKSFPGTNRRHTDLTAKTVVLRRGDDAIALVRTDTIGTWQDIVRDARARLREAGRPELAEGLVVVATHTHSSGGRVFDHLIGEIAVGPFLGAFYERIRDSIVDSVLAADDAAVAARVGHTTIQVPSLHSDRRCENGDIQDDTLGLVKVERADDGSTLAVLMNYAVHGTLLGNSDPVLSSDAPGALEHGVEHALDSETPVLFLQSWAGDMAPTVPGEHFVEEGHDLHEDYRRMDAMGAEAAALIPPALDGIETTGEPAIAVTSLKIPLDNDRINPDGTFDAYPHGGIYCMPSTNNCGEDAEPYTPGDLSCFPIPEDQTVDWTWMTAARIGDLGLVTLPGEPLTSVGTALRDAALAETGLSDVFVLGYAQSYLAYLLHPDDYFMGGYEGASALMGPGFGEYLVNMGAAVAGRMMDPGFELPFEPVELDPLDIPTYDDLDHETAEGSAAIVEEPTSEGDVRAVTWSGGDPATDAPLVRLERLDDDTWEALRYPSGDAFDSRGPHIELTLATEPSYEEAISLDSRTFLWTARLPTLFSVTPPGGQLEGTFRFVIDGTRPDAYTLTSEPFDI